jgi:hypothetical protein
LPARNSTNKRSGVNRGKIVVSMSANKITTGSPEIAHLRMGGPIADTPAKIPKEGRPGPGRPRGSKNKISRTMREAFAAAVEELGRTDLDQWDEVVERAADHPDPHKRFFMVAATRHLRTFMAVVARMIPTRVTHAPPQRYTTVEQARAELREAGIPDSIIDDMPTVDIGDVDPDEIVGRKSPYDDPETDDAPPEEGKRVLGSPPLKGAGRPPGSLNRISKTMKEALIGAVEVLGSTDIDKWEEIIKLAETDPDPYRRFFTIAAVRDLKIFMTVVGRLVPHHVIHSKQKRYMTVEAAKAELRAAGIPESYVDYMPTLDIDDVDPDEIVGREPCGLPIAS